MKHAIHCQGIRSKRCGTKRQKEIALEHGKTSGADRFVHYFNCEDGFTDIYVSQKYQIACPQYVP